MPFVAMRLVAAGAGDCGARVVPRIGASGIPRAVVGLNRGFVISGCVVGANEAFTAAEEPAGTDTATAAPGSGATRAGEGGGTVLALAGRL